MTHKPQIPRLKFDAAGFSDIGMRKNNEDTFLINKELGLFIVADGMGGHASGEIASWFTAENLANYVKNTIKPQSASWTVDPGLPVFENMTDEEILEYVIFLINNRIYEENQERLAKACQGYEWSEIVTEIARKKQMGTTLVSLLFRDDKAYITNIGDSRAYKISGNSIERLTHDHSWAEEQVKAGKLTKEEAKAHKKRNIITRSVGFKSDVEVDIEVSYAHPGEKFLLCSDGLSNVVSDPVLLEIARKGGVEDACREMVETALELGGKDNITAVLVHVPEDDAKVVPDTSDSDITDWTND